MDERVYGLVGRRLGHSWSVPIHAALGCEGYRLIELEPDALASFLARPDIGGLNVTIPYKRDVMPLCDAIDPAAEAIGSVNTIVRGADGKLTGYNTDIDGFLYMARRAGISLAGRKVVILGSGGASLTARAAARREGAREIIVISRAGPDNYENLSRHADAEILVNTTPVGMYPGNGAAPVDLNAFPHLTGVLDVIYTPRRTALLLQGSARGIPCSDGLPMLVAQAKRAEELFTGRPIPDSENERILSQLRREMTSIVLIGMPGSGKTSLGRLCAKALGRPFLDVDAAVEAAAGMAVSRIFQQEGEEGFRRRETQAVLKLARETGQVIATGGGCVLRRENLQALAQNGVILLVERPLDQLALGAGRPLSGSREAVEALYQARQPRYRQAAAGVIQNHTTLEEAARQATAEFLRLARPMAYRKDSNI